LGKPKNGIEISLSKLNVIRIVEDGKSGFFQGGVYDGQVIDELWDLGYLTLLVSSFPIPFVLGTDA
jgi:hypothetical protein